MSTIQGDLLWCDGGWPGSCHEHELLTRWGIDQVLDEIEVTTLVDRGFEGWPRLGRTGLRRPATGAPEISAPPLNAPTTVARPGCVPW